MPHTVIYPSAMMVLKSEVRTILMYIIYLTEGIVTMYNN